MPLPSIPRGASLSANGWDDAHAPLRLSADRWVLVALAVLAARFALFAALGRLDVDELENLQVIWLLEHGVWPVRDYVHTHPPFFNWMLQPVLDWIGPTPAVFTAMRLSLLPVIAATFAGYYWLVRETAGARVARIALVLSLGSPWVAVVAGQARHDAFTLILLTGALLCFARSARSSSPRAGWMLAAGALFGVSYLFTLKNGLSMLLTMAAFERLHARAGWSARRRWGTILAFALLAGLPYVAMSAWFYCLAGGWTPALLVMLTQFANQVHTPIMAHVHHVILVGFYVTHAVFIALAVYSRFRPDDRAAASPAPDAPPIPDARGLIAGLLFWIAVVNLVSPTLLDFAVPHMYIAPALFFAAGAAIVLARMSPRGALAWGLAALALAHGSMIFVHGNPAGRSEQVAQFDRVQQRVAPGVPVIDIVSGDGTFRPIIGRAIHYRRGLVASEHVDEQDPMVLSALCHREAGAVVDDAEGTFGAHWPGAVRSCLRRCYQPDDRYPFIWFPKSGSVKDCGFPRAKPIEGGIWTPPARERR